MARQIPTGRSQIIVWAQSSLALASSLFDDGSAGTTLFFFDAANDRIDSYRAGRPSAFNSLSTLAQWQGYLVQARSTLSLPDATLGFSNAPEGGGTLPANYDTILTVATTGTIVTSQGVSLNATIADRLEFIAMPSGANTFLSMVLLVESIAVGQVDFPSRYLGKRFSFRRNSTNTTYNQTSNVFTEGELVLT